jgi:hypothetical protein
VARSKEPQLAISCGPDDVVRRRRRRNRAVSPVPTVAVISMILSKAAKVNSPSYLVGSIVGLLGARLVVLTLGISSSDGAPSTACGSSRSSSFGQRGGPATPLKRHNDAAHPLYAITMLADFGFSKDDPGIARIAESVLEHFDGDQFETLVWLPRFLTNEDDAEQWDRAARLTPARSQPRFR